MKILSNINFYQALKMILFLPNQLNIKQGSVSENNNIFLPGFLRAINDYCRVDCWRMNGQKDGNKSKHFLVSRRYCPVMPNKFAIKQFKYNVDTIFRLFYLLLPSFDLGCSLLAFVWIYELFCAWQFPSACRSLDTNFVIAAVRQTQRSPNPPLIISFRTVACSTLDF